VVIEGSITGIFRTVLIVIGILVVLRFIGRLMIAKRNLDEERRLSENQREANRERNEKLRNFGKVNILKGKKATSFEKQEAEDVDFEELK
jgi:hypothetical protein